MSPRNTPVFSLGSSFQRLESTGTRLNRGVAVWHQARRATLSELRLDMWILGWRGTRARRGVCVCVCICVVVVVVVVVSRLLKSPPAAVVAVIRGRENDVGVHGVAGARAVAVVGVAGVVAVEALREQYSADVEGSCASVCSYCKRSMIYL